MKKKSIPTRKPEDIVRELEMLKAKKKEIEDREKALKNDLTVIIEGEGVTDSKGNIKLIVMDKLVQKQARKSVKLNHEKAEEILVRLGAWEEASDLKRVVNEDKLEQLVQEGLVPMEEVENMMDIKTTYAIVISDYSPEE